MVCLRSYSKKVGRVSQKVGPTHTSLLSVARRIRIGETQVWGDEDGVTQVIFWVKCELDYPGDRWVPQWDFRDARKEHLSFHRPSRDFSPIQVSTQQTAPDSGAGQQGSCPRRQPIRGAKSHWNNRKYLV